MLPTRWTVALFLALGAFGCGGEEPLGSPAGSGGGQVQGAGGAGAAAGGGAQGGSAAGGSSQGGAGSASGGSGGAGNGGAGGVPLAGFGVIVGDCGELDPPELMAMSMPQKLDNSLDFAMMPFDYTALSTGGKKVFDDGNLGGSSLYSEVFSYEVLFRCELASLLKTETEIGYDDVNGKKTDLLVEIDGLKIGVSVTRGYHFPPNTPYTVAQAQTLLDGKLSDILLSSANVNAADAWNKQILHILAYEMQHVTALQTAYTMLDPAVLADTIVLVTLTEGDDAFIYN
jgi:hypothetical protein